MGAVCSSVHAEGYRRVSHKNSAHLTPCHIDFHDGQIVSAPVSPNVSNASRSGYVHRNGPIQGEP